MTWQHTVLLVWMIYGFFQVWYFAGKGGWSHSPLYYIVLLLLDIPWLALFFTGREDGPLGWKHGVLLGSLAFGAVVCIFKIGQGGDDEDFGAVEAFFASLISLFLMWCLVTG